MLKIRRPLGRLIFNMGIAIPGKTVFLIETAPRPLYWADEVALFELTIRTEVIFRANKTNIFVRRTEVNFRANNLICWFVRTAIQLPCELFRKFIHTEVLKQNY